MTKVTRKTWNMDRVVMVLADGTLTIKGKSRGKNFEFQIPDAGLSDKLGEPSSVQTEGVL